jgi:hypothetical protein
LNGYKIFGSGYPAGTVIFESSTPGSYHFYFNSVVFCEVILVGGGGGGSATKYSSGSFQGGAGGGGSGSYLKINQWCERGWDYVI